VTLDPVSLVSIGLPGDPAASLAATGKPPAGKTKEIAEQFEAIFLTQILKGLRKTVPVADEGDAARDLYHELFDETIAAHVARSGGFGLGAILKQSLDRLASPSPPETERK
jgi:peptidoglycan hydrolase FlgJ